MVFQKKKKKLSQPPESLPSAALVMEKQESGRLVGNMRRLPERGNTELKRMNKKDGGRKTEVNRR